MARDTGLRSRASASWTRGRRGLRAVLVLAGLLTPLVAVSCGSDGGSGGEAATGTVAYILTSCRQKGDLMTLQQELRVQRGGAEVTVTTVGPVGPLESLACVGFGLRRLPFATEGPLVRWGLTPDGTGVVFEVNDEYVSFGRGMLPPEQLGLYYVRADGSDLRRLGPPSRSPAFHAAFGFFLNDRGLNFDPSGRRFVYVDYGTDESGQQAAQIFEQSLVPGEPKRQVTRLPALDLPQGAPETGGPRFVDEETILFARWPAETPGIESLATVDVGGMDVREVPLLDLGGGHVVPIFQITGQDQVAVSSAVPGVPENPQANLPIIEVFVINGTDLVQMTNFRRTDTSLGRPLYSNRDGRVYFTASADPQGTNPDKACQIFSIDALGSDLRQLTHFETPAELGEGCVGGASQCRVDLAGQNPETGTVLFISSCDPLGQNPHGRQVFAMQPDGSDLRQLTSASGLVASPDGSIEVETVSRLFIAPRSGQ